MYPTGSKINHIYQMSFLVDDEVINESIAFIIQFSDSNWYKLIIGDGIGSFIQINNEIEDLKNSQKVDNYLYKLQEIDIPRSIFDQFLKDIKLCLWNGRRDECCGIVLIFSNNTQVCFFEKNEILIMIPAFDEEIKKECSMVSII